MKSEYDFGRSKKNPYTRLLKRPVTIRLETETVDYFKTIATEIGIPYQQLINLYLRDCVSTRRKLALKWAS
jgi:predicted DNA binding CopG/RHH family protein